jgi:predicted sugar kinase
MLPALAERDERAFSEALYDFNQRVGEIFRRVQGGIYASATTADVVAYLRRQGVRGVGQSSWGPSVFAVLADEEQAEILVEEVREHFGWGAADVLCAQACNRGAALNTSEG